MKDGERGRPIENYGKKQQKEWLDNTLPDSHPCTAGNKEEEHIFYLTDKDGNSSRIVAALNVSHSPDGATVNPPLYLYANCWGL